MRILHTSDWHLGLGSGSVSRAPDHDLVLDWLIATLDREAIDVLLIAGDVFDSASPSADALARYYRFLARASNTGVQHVVVIGGNHDSASQLDAPAGVLEALKVHVVGGISSAANAQEICLLPLQDASGEVALVVLAVPFVHEFWLGLRTTDLDIAATRKAFRERFSAMYRDLTDQAVSHFPGVPIVALGHLTVGAEVREEDAPRKIHAVGTIDALPSSIFDPRIDYVALGHIHRSYPTDAARRIWYSGTPLATSLPEAKVPRKMLRLDLSEAGAGPPEVTALEVPSPRALLPLALTPEAMVEAVRTLSWTEALPPHLYCHALTDGSIQGLRQQLSDALTAHPEASRPVIAELKPVRQTALPEATDQPQPSLDELNPTEVFAKLLRAAAPPNAPELTRAFAELASLSPEGLESLVASVEGGQA